MPKGAQQPEPDFMPGENWIQQSQVSSQHQSLQTSHRHPKAFRCQPSRNRTHLQVGMLEQLETTVAKVQDESRGVRVQTLMTYSSTRTSSSDHSFSSAVMMEVSNCRRSTHSLTLHQLNWEPISYRVKQPMLRVQLR